jgi:hypothetical protein
VLDALWELARIPMPREGKRDVQSMQRFARDVEEARTHTRDLLSKLAGYQAEADDVAHAKVELVAETKEALGKAQEWLTQRQKDNWQ